MALVFRHRVRKDRLIGKWFRILDESDPGARRVPAFSGQLLPSGAGRARWRSGTRRGARTNSCSTRRGSRLYVVETGMNGYDFREKS